MGPLANGHRVPLQDLAPGDLRQSFRVAADLEERRVIRIPECGRSGRIVDVPTSAWLAYLVLCL